MAPGTVVNGRAHIEHKWDANFINCSARTRYHGRPAPMSRLLTFTDGSKRVRVQCYLHTNTFAQQGWYAPSERTIVLNEPVRLG